jgi:prophage antirepressor-like protein
MSDLIPFHYGEHVFTVRLDPDGNPWFIGGDTADLLGYANTRQSLARLDDDEKGVYSVDTPGGRQDVTFVNEAGLYSLILRSRKPEAKAFKRWVTHEVLPQIRKTGRYETPASATALDRYPELKALAEQARTVVALVASTAEARSIAEAAQQDATTAKALAQQALDSQQWLTIREYVFLNTLDRQCPPSLQQEYGRWLTGYCAEHRIPVRNVLVAGQKWGQEHAYHVGTIERTLPGFLARQHGQGALIPFPRHYEGA